MTLCLGRMKATGEFCERLDAIILHEDEVHLCIKTVVLKSTTRNDSDITEGPRKEQEANKVAAL